MAQTLTKIRIIARFTLLEAWRARLPWIALATAGVLLLASLFVKHVAVTETTRMQVGFLSAALRLTTLFLLTLHVAASIVREFNDKGVDLLLALDLPRAGYYLGRFAGFAVIAVLLAALAGLTLLLATRSPAVAAWALSLALEGIVVAALALFSVVTFAHIMPAMSFVIAFYLLARGLTAIRLLARSPLLSPSEWTTQAVGWLVDGLSWVLPDFSRFALTSWLVTVPPSSSELRFLTTQTLVYGTLLVCAGLYDLYRKNL
jgi:ABC-type transport system involved in multi-copper enzyme maturation permease subunit